MQFIINFVCKFFLSKILNNCSGVQRAIYPSELYRARSMQRHGGMVSKYLYLSTVLSKCTCTSYSTAVNLLHQLVSGDCLLVGAKQLIYEAIRPIKKKSRAVGHQTKIMVVFKNKKNHSVSHMRKLERLSWQNVSFLHQIPSYKHRRENSYNTQN